MAGEQQRRGSWKTRENESVERQAALAASQKAAQKNKRQHPQDPEDVIAEKRLRDHNNSFIFTEPAVPKKYRRKDVFKPAAPQSKTATQFPVTQEPGLRLAVLRSEHKRANVGSHQDTPHEGQPTRPAVERLGSVLRDPSPGAQTHNSPVLESSQPTPLRQGETRSQSIVPSSVAVTQEASSRNRHDILNGQRYDDDLDGLSDDDDGEGRHGQETNNEPYGPPEPPSPSQTAAYDNHRDMSPTHTLSSDSEPDEDPRSRRAPRGSVNSNPNHPKIADYPHNTQTILRLALDIFRCHIATEAPFATPNQEKLLSGEAFTSACRALGKDYEPTEDQLIIIRKGACQMRGKLKELAETAVPLFYKFVQSGSHAHKNRLQYKKLTTSDAYTYEDSDSLVGIWFTPLLFTLVHGMWFKKEEDDGIKYPKYFSPQVSAQNIALVLTAIRCVLDGWKEGLHRQHQFKTDTYRHVYRHLLSGLRDLRKTPDGAEVLQGLGTELWESGSSQFLDGPRHKAPTFDSVANAHAAEHFRARVERKRIEREENIEGETAY
ncbi:hypothetical protein BOTBODRAFT_181700 [Botryobasidium botryosum FD-172 SS1]|uniref:DUF6532 domain-containing protein n=1 Tax=Botryobasidium botryosum (strain FD-172 SS1) TaxID=930990 RepID=A0A067LSX1_BOTB1|nr:hypothetical protein BOTBODRAFT_181700 [Botryobasidium botryosum FD-172 SS1]